MSDEKTTKDPDKDLKELKRKMRRIKWCFHFTRNNPNHTAQFYFRLREIVGPKDWDNLRPDIRQAWEDAANSFDRQYGLVLAWLEHPEALKPDTDREKKVKAAQSQLAGMIPAIEEQTKAVGDLIELLKKSPVELTNNKLTAMEQSAQGARAAAAEALKALNACLAVITCAQGKQKEEDPAS